MEQVGSLVPTFGRHCSNSTCQTLSCILSLALSQAVKTAWQNSVVKVAELARCFPPCQPDLSAKLIIVVNIMQVKKSCLQNEETTCHNMFKATVTASRLKSFLGCLLHPPCQTPSFPETESERYRNI